MGNIPPDAEEMVWDALYGYKEHNSKGMRVRGPGPPPAIKRIAEMHGRAAGAAVGQTAQVAVDQAFQNAQDFMQTMGFAVKSVSGVEYMQDLTWVEVSPEETLTRKYMMQNWFAQSLPFNEADQDFMTRAVLVIGTMTDRNHDVATMIAKFLKCESSWRAIPGHVLDKIRVSEYELQGTDVRMGVNLDLISKPMAEGTVAKHGSYVLFKGSGLLNKTWNWALGWWDRWAVTPWEFNVKTNDTYPMIGSEAPMTGSKCYEGVSWSLVPKSPETAETRTLAEVVDGTVSCAECAPHDPDAQDILPAHHMMFVWINLGGSVK